MTQIEEIQQKLIMELQETFNSQSKLLVLEMHNRKKLEIEIDNLKNKRWFKKVL